MANANLVVWNGATWQPYMEPYFEGQAVYALQQGDGMNFYAGGWFTQAGATQANGIAVWDETLGITDLGNTGSANIYPNPNNGSFCISIPTGAAQSIINIYDAMGNLLIQSTLNAGKNQFEMNKPANGVYFYRVITPGGDEMDAGKIVVAGRE